MYTQINPDTVEAKKDGVLIKVILMEKGAATFAFMSVAQAEELTAKLRVAIEEAA